MDENVKNIEMFRWEITISLERGGYDLSDFVRSFDSLNEDGKLRLMQEYDSKPSNDEKWEVIRKFMYD